MTTVADDRTANRPYRLSAPRLQADGRVLGGRPAAMGLERS